MSQGRLAGCVISWTGRPDTLSWHDQHASENMAKDCVFAYVHGLVVHLSDDYTAPTRWSASVLARFNSRITNQFDDLIIRVVCITLHHRDCILHRSSPRNTKQKCTYLRTPVKLKGPSHFYMEQKPESLIYSAESSLWEAASSLTRSVEMKCEDLLERADMVGAY